MEKPAIKGKIIKSEPDSEYEGRVYDQFVFFELQDGVTILLEDHRMFVKDEMIGKVKTIRITLFLPQIVKIPEEKYAVNSGAEHLPCRRISSFYGKLIEANGKWDRLIVDIGSGFIEVDVLGSESESLKIGDFLKMDVYRIDLNEIYDQ